MPLPTTLMGLDFSCAPSQRKPLTLAVGRRAASVVRLDRLDTFQTLDAWVQVLRAPGEGFVMGCDFPFGLPREAIIDLGWPQTWPALVRHCAALGKPAFRAALDAYRESRPVGRRYAHRATDLPARSHSPLKLVNPPVGLMFLEGGPRLLAAGVHVPGVHDGDAQRVAIEAYPRAIALE